MAGLSWMSELIKTYDNLSNSRALGDIPPLPISHSLQNAHIEIRLNPDGTFFQAYMIPKEDALTIVPVTEDSASRSSGITPHVLYDKLSYIARDCADYTKDEKSRKCYDAYIKQLSEWRNDENSPMEVKVIYEYLSNGTIIEDLLKCGILELDSEGKLSSKWNGDKNNKPGNIVSSFVRFIVYKDDGSFIKCNDNKTLFNSFSEYYNKRNADKRVCYVTGEYRPYTEKHPAKIRNGGDTAKLISSNDKSGFTYRGRFKEGKDALSISYEASQKAHNALRWLVKNYGWFVGDETIVAWSVQGNEYPSLRKDTYDVISDSFYDPDDGETSAENAVDLINGRSVADLKKAVNGYRKKNFNSEGKLDNVVVMGIEAATPGRLSITMYHEIAGSDYLDKIENWHTNCAWPHSYKLVYIEKDGKQESKHVNFIGAPSPEDIVKAAYGDNVKDKIKKDSIKKIVEFIVTGKRGMFPNAAMRYAVRRVSNPMCMEDWELRKNTTIACSLIRMYRNTIYGEEYKMELDNNQDIQKERNFMFGRILAYMEKIEEKAIERQAGYDGVKRTPNAIKLRNIYVSRPVTTLMTLNTKLTPYIERLYLSKNGMYVDNSLYSEMQELMAEMIEYGMLKADGKMDNTPLDERYLLGYACQINELNKKNNKKNN